MYKLMNTILVLGLVCGPLLAGCGGEPRIEVVQNLRNLCNFTVSGVLDEGRCTNDAACNQIEDDFCWQPEPEGAVGCTGHADCGEDEVCYKNFCYLACETDADCEGLHGYPECFANGDLEGTKACRSHGYCRLCGHDGQCETGVCDNGWCREECSADVDCDTGLRCTGGLCRPPHSTEFSLCNVGDRKLKIHAGETAVRGEADAVVFCDYEWSDAEDPIVVSPGDCAYLQVRFRPPEVGEYRAWIDVYSNDDTLNPLSLLLCGQAVAAECKESLDGECSKCIFCSEDGFAGYADKEHVCQ